MGSSGCTHVITYHNERNHVDWRDPKPWRGSTKADAKKAAKRFKKRSGKR